MIFRQKAMLRTAIRPKRKVVAGRTLRNGVARRGYRGVPVDDFRASFPLSGMTLSVVLGRTPWRAVRESYTDCREYMPLPPFVSPRPAEDVPAGCRSSAAAETAYFLKEYGCGGYWFDIMGYCKNGKPEFVEITLEQRKNGLPEKYIIIEDCDEFYYCIDSVSGKISSWSQYDKDGIRERFDNFYEFFKDNLQNAMDNF